MTQDGGSDSPYCGPTENTACATIQQAIDNISPSSHDENVTVCVLSMGTSYPCPEGGEGVSIINKSLSLQASGGMVTMDCQGRGRALFLRNVTYFALQGFVIQNGRADQGGGVLAIDVEELYFSGNVFSDNVCTQGWGGAINAYNVKTLGVGENRFVNNLATGSNATGGGVLMQRVSRCEVWDSEFVDNVVADDGLGGGALSILSGDVITIRGCNFSSNVAQFSLNGSGGGALLVGDVSIFAVEGCRFDNNSAYGANGGAISVFPPTLSPRVHIRGCDLRDNTASASYNGGGAVAVGYIGLLQIEATNFTKNVANKTVGGGAIYSYQSEGFRVSGCRFVGNLFDSGREDDPYYSHVYGGGAIVSDNSDLRIAETTFEDNISIESQGGGAIYVVRNGSVHVTDSSFRNNIAVDSLGGGAFCSGNARSIVFARTSFVNNSIPSGLGGAIFMNNTAAELRISVSGFHSNNAGSGGALYLYVNTHLRVSLEDNRFQGNGASSMGQ